VPLSADIQRQYSRSDPRGHFPRITEASDIGCNRLAMFWRPIIDMTHSEMAPVSLRMVSLLSSWIAAPGTSRVSWFSRMAVPGQRSQVLRHAGLDAYDAMRPADLAPELRTPSWQRLVDILGGFDALDSGTRALVVFHLAQLTYTRYVITLTQGLPLTGKPADDHYAYEVARARARVPGHASSAIGIFESLAGSADPFIAYHACFQGIAHALRALNQVGTARRFAHLAERLPAIDGDWLAHMTLSRFCRAMARLLMAEGQPHAVREELDMAWRYQQMMAADAPDEPEARLLTDENLRDLMEFEIESAGVGIIDTPPDRLIEYAKGVIGIDPNAVDARLAAGDGYMAAGDDAIAAHWYARAGELGTTAGAVGWYRAGQCYDRLGDYDSAVNAMARCLELDTTAVEPKQYLEKRG
jgi:tetratricopeptide (TPR) repeat protein